MPRPTRQPARTTRGFTLINLMVSIAVMALVAGIVLITLEPDDRARALGAAQMVAADIEYAQSLSLANPADPAVVRIDAANDGYWIALVSAPDDPVLKPNGLPYIVILGEGDAASFSGVDLAVVSGATDSRVEFDAFGRLSDLQDAVLSLTLAGEESDVTVSSSTGFSLVAPVGP